jgi:hypothetical protein
MSDAPDGPPELAGGKLAGDPGMEDASETGGASMGTPAGKPDDNLSELPGAKGGGGGGGSGQGA